MSFPDMEQIYLEYHDKVMGYIRARVQGWADAEDLCADVFEKVQRKLPDYDPSKASVSTWVFTITRNTVIDFFRRSKHQEELDENIFDDSAVDDDLLQTEMLGELATALRKLPQQLMDIIVLRYYDRKTLREIAFMTKMSYGAVKLRHQNALMLLKEQMNVKNS